MRIVLASGSMFRRRALEVLGLKYEVWPSNIDEKAIRERNPAELTRKLAEAKAWKVAGEFPGAVVISGDAVAVKGEKIFEKPRDEKEAGESLRELSGSKFEFVTSLAVLHTGKQKMLSTAEAAEITFRRLEEREIHEYIGRYEVVNYAGAFESDAVLRFAERICGSYNFVTALPVSRLVVFLRELGVEV